MVNQHLTSKKIIIAAAALIFIGFFSVRQLITTEEREIQKRLAALADNVSRSRGDGNIRLSLKNQKLQTMFSDPCRISIPRRDIEVSKNPRDLASDIFRFHTRAQRVNIRFYDTAISLLNDTEAVISATVSAEGEMQTGERFSETEEIRIELVKENDEWLFSSFEQVEVLQR